MFVNNEIYDGLIYSFLKEFNVCKLFSSFLLYKYYLKLSDVF